MNKLTYEQQKQLGADIPWAIEKWFGGGACGVVFYAPKGGSVHPQIINGDSDAGFYNRAGSFIEKVMKSNFDTSKNPYVVVFTYNHETQGFDLQRPGTVILYGASGYKKEFYEAGFAPNDEDAKKTLLKKAMATAIKNGYDLMLDDFVVSFEDKAVYGNMTYSKAEYKRGD